MEWSSFWTLLKQPVGCPRCGRMAPTKHLLSDSTLGFATRIFPISSGCTATTFSPGKMRPTTHWCRPLRVGSEASDSNHIHTVELNYSTSGSLEDQSWAPLIELNAAYTYFPTYAQVLTEYNRSNFKPVFMVEANYEFEHNSGTDGGSTQNLRRQEYWTMLSGATGQLYGSAYTWQLQKGWKSNLDTPGVVQLSYMKSLFASKRWYDLVPDQTHTVVISGYDGFSCLVGKVLADVGKHPNFILGFLVRIRKYSAVGSITTSTCATTARTSDGSSVIAYLPTIRTITVDMSKLASKATARWYDPTNGTYADIDGSPFANTGNRRFTPPGNNSSGDGDWVLVLEASAAP